MTDQPSDAARPSASRARGAALGGAALGVTVLFAPAADAATFEVTTTADSGAGSLRQAVLDANAAPGADTITFRSDVTGTIGLTSGELAVTEALTLDGPGAAALTVDGGNAGRILNVSAGPTAVEGLTLTHGTATPGGAINATAGALTVRDSVITGSTAGGQGGGGIFASGAGLAVVDSTISGNAATGGRGGGIAADHLSGPLHVEGSTISGNTSTGRGGGLSGYGTFGGGFPVEVVDSTISGNTATSRGGGLFLYNVATVTVDGSTLTDNQTNNRGGGLFLYKPSGAVEIRESTISSNRAPSGTGRGGGLFFYKTATGVPITIEDSTVAGNTAGLHGGGLFFYRTNGPVHVVDSTISANTAAQSGGGVFTQGTFASAVGMDFTGATVAGNTAGTDGGGLALTGAGLPPTALRSTIVADNAATGSGPDLTGTVNADYALIENATGATVNDTTPGSNVLGADPQLGALGNHGGPTATQVPAATSPALDAGKTYTSALDQRGVARPLDFAGLVNATDGTDIGAVEVSGTVAVAGTTPSGSGDSTTPLVKGTSDGPVATVELYDNAACTGTALGSGTAAAFAGAGVAATVPPGAKTTIYARGLDAGGRQVACSATGIDYAANAPIPLPIITPPGPPQTQAPKPITTIPVSAFDPRCRRVPTLIGRTAVSAKKVLKRDNCSSLKLVVKTTKATKKNAKGAARVYKQTPKAGTRPLKGSSITLYVRKG